MKEKYQYTGFTKEAIHKTQNVGYQNEYYYLAVTLLILIIIENIMNL